MKLFPKPNLERMILDSLYPPLRVGRSSFFHTFLPDDNENITYKRNFLAYHWNLYFQTENQSLQSIVYDLRELFKEELQYYQNISRESSKKEYVMGFLGFFLGTSPIFPFNVIGYWTFFSSFYSSLARAIWEDQLKYALQQPEEVYYQSLHTIIQKYGLQQQQKEISPKER